MLNEVILELLLLPTDVSGKPLISLASSSVYQFGHLIRMTENLLLKLFSDGLLSGTTHTCLGQELCQMAVVRALTEPGDQVFSNHRNHGHFLTYTGDVLGLVAEIMGRRQGVCGGIGGSQHLAVRHFHSNGVQGGMTAIGVGQALARRTRGEQGVTAIIIGDGTLGEGLLYESMNLASIWELPVLFVVEHNHIAQTTLTSLVVGGDIEARGRAFGLESTSLSDDDPEFLADVERVIACVRQGRPSLLVIDTERLGPHSKGDDLRDPEEMERIRKRDPLTRIGRELSQVERELIERQNEERVALVHQQALASLPADVLVAEQHVYLPARNHVAAHHKPLGGNVRTQLNSALDELLSEEPRVLLLGEDLHDPYGGAFKVTANLSTRYKGRVISTPISEAAVVGAGIGLALEGYLPVVEVMFADFLTLSMDQIFNHAVKFPGMFPNMPVPLVIRTPSGGGRGYGSTHSQSPENIVASIPGLTVLFPSHRHPVGGILKNAVLRWPNPTVFFEHKLLYAETALPGAYRQLDTDNDVGLDLFPTMAWGDESADVTLVAYGAAVKLAEQVRSGLIAEEISVEIVAPALLSPLPHRQLCGHLISRAAVVVIEEGYAETGFGTALGTALLEAGFRGRFARVHPPPVPIPAARSLEALVLPGYEAVKDKILSVLAL